MILLLALACTQDDDDTDVVVDTDRPADTDSDGPIDTDVEDTDDSDVTPILDRWTFLVFMNGDNNLEGYVAHDLNELEQVGSTPGVNVIVQADRVEGYADDDGDWTGTRRYLIQPDNDLRTVTSPVLQDLGELDMGDPAVLTDFLLWADEQYPAEHVAVILWDHGDGWTVAQSNAISWDDTDGSSISVARGELAAALAPLVERRGEPIDLIGFDACNMASFEVAYALHPYARYLVASQVTVGAEGLQYGLGLSVITEDTGATGFSLGLAFASTQVLEGGEATASLTDLGRMPDLAAALDEFAGVLLASEDHVRWYKNARDRMRSCDRSYHDWYVDMGDMARVCAASDNPDIAAAATSLDVAIGEAVPAAFGNENYHWTSGLTIFNASYHDYYLDLYRNGQGATWSRDTRWDEVMYSIAAQEN